MTNEQKVHIRVLNVPKYGNDTHLEFQHLCGIPIREPWIIVDYKNLCKLILNNINICKTCLKAHNAKLKKQDKNKLNIKYNYKTSNCFQKLRWIPRYKKFTRIFNWDVWTDYTSSIFKIQKQKNKLFIAFFKIGFTCWKRIQI